MTKAIQFFLFCVIIQSTQAQKEFHFSGQITNAPTSVLNITAPGFENVIQLDENGFFDEIFDIPHNGAYAVNKHNFYFEQGKDLNIAGNLDSVMAFSFSGSLAPENLYWQQKTQKNITFFADSMLFQLPIVGFRTQKTIFNDSLKVLKSGIQNENFLKLEEKAVFYISELQEYQYWLEQKVPKKKELKAFMASFNQLDVYDEALFLFSTDYRNLSKRKLYVVDEYFKPAKNLTDNQYHEYVINYRLAQRNRVKSNVIKDDLGLAIINEIKTNETGTFINFVYDSIFKSTTDEFVKSKILNDIAVRHQLREGAFSPDFEYENFLGGTTKLSDFRGKLVYIDIWATWCGPCIEQYPYFKQLEEQYKNKEIAFITISTDYVKDYDKWKKMVADKGETGYSLFAKKSFGADFINYFRVRYIPRFILIGKNGEILSSDAPQPSNKETIENLINANLK